MEVKNLDCAMNELFDFITDTPSGLDGFESDFDAAFSELKKVKSDNVIEIVHARWVKLGCGRYYCSHCHGVDEDCSDYYSIHDVTGQDYCPYCGALMDLGVEENESYH